MRCWNLHLKEADSFCTFSGISYVFLTVNKRGRKKVKQQNRRKSEQPFSRPNFSQFISFLLDFCNNFYSNCDKIRPKTRLNLSKFSDNDLIWFDSIYRVVKFAHNYYNFYALCNGVWCKLVVRPFFFFILIVKSWCFSFLVER